ncbi:helix-turn-helix domain-containing protein [Deinococcus sp. UYEF24]
MTQTELVLDTWSHLPQEVRDLTTPIETETQYQDALRLFEAVWDQVGETPDHPLGSLFVLLQSRITVYESRVFPVPAAPPERVLAFLMEQRDMTQTQLAEVLGINQANVSRLLNGKSQFTLETVRVLAGHFHVNPEVFLAS